MNQSIREAKPIQSLKVGLRILDSLGEFKQGASLSLLAARCDISQSKLHRYLATFVQNSVVVQNPKTGEYALGVAALKLGLSALKQINLFSRVNDQLESIARITNCHAFMTVWSSAGPILMRWAYSTDSLVTNTIPGQVLSVTRSSAGQLYAAFLPEHVTRELVERELSSFGVTDDVRKNLLERIKKVVENRFARSIGESEPHLQSVSVPIFDWHDSWMVTVGVALPVESDIVLVDAKLGVLKQFAERMSIRPTVHPMMP